MKNKKAISYLIISAMAVQVIGITPAVSLAGNMQNSQIEKDLSEKGDNHKEDNFNKENTAGLKSITINGEKIEIINQNIHHYDLKIDEEVEKLIVETELIDTEDVVTILGQDTVNKNGIANVVIKVQSKDHRVKTYNVTVRTIQSQNQDKDKDKDQDQNKEGLSIVSMTPSKNDKNVSLDSSIEISFSKELDIESVTSQNVYLLDDDEDIVIESTIELSEDRKKITIKPSAKLKADTEYEVVVKKDISTVDKESLKNKVSWEFKTEKKEIEGVSTLKAPKSLDGKSLSAFSIEWEWKFKDKDSKYSDDQYGFIIRDEEGNIVGEVKGKDTNKFIENGLTPDTKYKRSVSVYVIDESGERTESGQSSFENEETKEEKIKKSKINAPYVFTKVEDITAEKITWKWNETGTEGQMLYVYDEDEKEIGKTELSTQIYEENIDMNKEDKKVVRKFKIFDTATNTWSKDSKVKVVNPFYGTSKDLNAPKVKISSIKNGKAFITIKDRSKDEVGFKVYSTDKEGTIIEMVEEVKTLDSKGTNKNLKITLEGLEKEQTYYYVVKAYNDTTEGVASYIMDLND